MPALIHSYALYHNVSRKIASPFAFIFLNCGIHLYLHIYKVRISACMSAYPYTKNTDTHTHTWNLYVCLRIRMWFNIIYSGFYSDFDRDLFCLGAIQNGIVHFLLGKLREKWNSVFDKTIPNMHVSMGRYSISNPLCQSIRVKTITQLYRTRK